MFIIHLAALFKTEKSMLSACYFLILESFRDNKVQSSKNFRFWLELSIWNFDFKCHEQRFTAGLFFALS